MTILYCAYIVMHQLLTYAYICMFIRVRLSVSLSVDAVVRFASKLPSINLVLPMDYAIFTPIIRPPCVKKCLLKNGDTNKNLYRIFTKPGMLMPCAFYPHQVHVFIGPLTPNLYKDREKFMII